MNTIQCPGLDGSNPLHFLASLGVMRLATQGDDEIKMSWHFNNGGWHPCFSSNQNKDENDFVQQLSTWTKEIGKTSHIDPKLKKQAADLSAKIKKDEKKRKEKIKGQKKSSKGKDVTNESDPLKREIDELDTAIKEEKKHLATLQIQIGDSLGQGVAHLGDIIGVNPDLFRYKAKLALDKMNGGSICCSPSVDNAQLIVACLPSLACDQIFEDGKLAYTPFSFSNGGSGQCLLKDFRECAKATTEAHIKGTLFGIPIYERTLSSLGWDPSDQSLYAVQWQAPEVTNKKGTKEVDPAIQTFAYVGLSLLPALPVNGVLTAVGWETDLGRRIFCWPMWDMNLSLSVIMSVLALGRNQAMKTPGLPTIFSVSVQNPNGKRNFFSPSRSL